MISRDLEGMIFSVRQAVKYVVYTFNDPVYIFGECAGHTSVKFSSWSKGVHSSSGVVNKSTAQDILSLLLNS